jgi:hypothetical protein
MRIKPLAASMSPRLTIVMIGLLAGCASTTKPVYEGLLADGREPTASAKRMPEIKAADGIAIVLSQSTRDTVKRFKEDSKSVGGLTLSYPTEKWIANIASPVRRLNASVRTVPDLIAKLPGSWVVVIHWTMVMVPLHTGAGIEYHVLDSDLNRVGVFRASDGENCDPFGPTGQAFIDGRLRCYDRLVSGLIQKASAEMLANAQ